MHKIFSMGADKGYLEVQYFRLDIRGEQPEISRFALEIVKEYFEGRTAEGFIVVEIKEGDQLGKPIQTLPAEQ